MFFFIVKNLGLFITSSRRGEEIKPMSTGLFYSLHENIVNIE